MKLHDVTFVLVTHHSEAVLGGCLAALGDVWPSPCVVVDNASRDGSVRCAESAGAVVLRQDENRGFAHAANRGAHEARTAWVCFLNPDVTVTRELREAFARTAPAAGPDRLLVPDYVDKHGDAVPGRQPGYTPWKLWADLLESRQRHPALLRWCRTRLGYHDRSWHWPLAACFFAPRAGFLERGGFDERYFLYMEDVDLGCRWCRSGGHVERLEATVSHRGQEGAQVAPAWRQRHLDEARRQFGRRHYGPLWNTLIGLTTG